MPRRERYRPNWRDSFDPSRHKAAPTKSIVAAIQPPCAFRMIRASATPLANDILPFRPPLGHRLNLTGNFARRAN
jgi:hypothetical protein